MRLRLPLRLQKKIKDDDFIVPLRLARYDSPLLKAHAQYIDFEKGWSQGLSELVSLLKEVKIPQPHDVVNLELWRGVQLKDARSISSSAERLISNWLAIEAVPECVYFYDFKGGISVGAAQRAIRDSPIPVVAFNRGFLSFAALPELEDYFGPDLPLELIAQHSSQEFLQNGWPDLHMLLNDARAKFADLARRALNRFLGEKGLRSFELASERLVWWPTLALGTISQRSFACPEGPAGRRQLVGRSKKRRFYWHYGVSCWARNVPIPHVRITGHVVFTSDGQLAIGDAERLHRMRRSFCKSWRNDKWRDLLLAFWHWIAAGAAIIEVPLCEAAALKLRLPPVTFDADFGIETAADFPPSGADEDEEEEETILDEYSDEDGHDDPDESA